MARIHRVSGYLVDPLGFYTEDEVVRDLSEAVHTGWMEQLHVETSNYFNWSDDLPEAKPHCDLAHLAKHFKRPEEEPDVSKIKVGGLYRHFKEGKIVEVLAIGRHSETQELLVVYSCSNGVWCRPASMFTSFVDAKKYPEHAGERRFTLLVCREDAKDD